jgi:DNA-binding transcriptional LysR family regulator
LALQIGHKKVITFGLKHANVQHMEWENWQSALMVAQLGTVAAAAARMNVDATTVSRRIKRLESKLGARLFERQGLRLRATDSFRIALASVEAADSALQLAQEQLGHQSPKTFQRTIRITAAPFLVDHLLVPGLAELRRQANFRFELIADNRNLSLTRREADIAVRFDVPHARMDAEGVQLGSIGYAVYGTKGLDPKGLPWAALDDAYAHLPEARWTARALRKLQPDFKANRTETIREIVAGGMAKALLPQLLGETDRRLQRVSDPFVLKRAVGVLRPVGERAIPQLDIVTRWLGELFKQPNALSLGLTPT